MNRLAAAEARRDCHHPTTKAPLSRGLRMLLPEMDSNHQPAGNTLAAIPGLSDDELAAAPEHDEIAPVIVLGAGREQLLAVHA